MTGFKIADEWLDFTAAVGLEIRNPLFDAGTVPGTLSYPIAFADTPANRRRLRFPATRARQAAAPLVLVLEADYYIGGLLWRRGTLRYQGYDSAAREYTYQFEADAAALASRLDGARPPDAVAVELLAVERAPDNGDYVLAPIRNSAFYDAAKNPAWGKVVNYFAPGAGLASVNTATGPHTHTLVPLFKYVPLLRAAFAQFGYTLSGAWLDDPEIQQLVVYATRALDQPLSQEPAPTFLPGAALPDVRVADLLLAPQALFCLGYVHNPTRREITVVALRDVVAGAGARARTARAGFRDVANETDGFRLAFTADGDDALAKDAPLPELRVGNAQETIQPAADTLRMVREEDPLQPGRRWLVPAAEQVGQTPRVDFEQGDHRLEHLRFLFYRGLQPDSTGALYPLASAGTVNYDYQTVGQYALAWDGEQGLYQTWHKPWLDFRQAARLEERDVLLSLGEFLRLDPTAKDEVLGLHFLWERISLSAGGDGTLSDATITYHQLAR